MINVAVLQESVLRAREGGYMGSVVGTHDFGTDDINECAGDFNFMLMSESNEINEIEMMTDEIMAEAAIRNPDTVNGIVESVFDTMKTKIVNFFKKVIEMIKGMLVKIKAFFQRMMGKTTKWAETMKKPLEKVWNGGGNWRDFEYEMYEYKETYILDTMPGFADAITDGWNNAMGAGDKALDKVSAMVDDIKSAANTDSDIIKGVDKDDKDELTKEAEKGRMSQTDAQIESTEAWNEKWAETLGKYLGGASGSDVDAVWVDVSREARTEQKTARRIGGDTNKMYETVKGAAEKIRKLEKGYEKHLKDVTKAKDKLERQNLGSVKMNEKNADGTGGVFAEAKRHISAVYAHYTNITTKHEAALNTLRQKNIALVQDMCQSYMAALTKFASYKASKK